LLKIPFIKSIFIAPSVGPNPPPAGGYSIWNPMEEKKVVEVVENKGIVGDRFFDVNCFKLQNGKIMNFPTSRNVSFINFENIEKIKKIYNVEEKDLRRNFIIKNLNVEFLLNKKFKIGNVLFLGVTLCRSCNHIEQATKIKGLSKILAPMGGLRAQCLCNGKF
jgi:hypothetical protein